MRDDVEAQLVPMPGGTETYVRCRSTARREKELAIRRRCSTRLEDRLQRLARRVATGRLKDRPKIERARGRLQARSATPALPCCHVPLRGQKPLPSTYPTELHTVGDYLRKRRLDRGLLQREAAVQIGVNTTTITNWELGHTTPALCWLPHVIRFLGYDP